MHSSNCSSELHQHPAKVCRKARCFDKPSLGTFPARKSKTKQHRQTNCQSGVHDGLKVAMPGDRLVIGGATLHETNAARQRSATQLSIRTADVQAPLYNPSLGNLSKLIGGDCRRGVHRYWFESDRRPICQTMVGVAQWESASLANPSSPLAKKHDRLPIGVHDLGSGGCGFESHRRHWRIARRAVAQRQSTVTLWSILRRSSLYRSTVCVEYIGEKP